MTAYAIEFRPAALRELEALPRNDQKRIKNRIAALALDPFPSGCKKLKGFEWFRVRAGDYRVIYQVQQQHLVVLIITIGHRSDVYRRL